MCKRRFAKVKTAVSWMESAELKGRKNNEVQPTQVAPRCYIEYVIYLTSSSKDCASAMFMQAWHCSRLALYLTSSKFTGAVYQ